MRAVNRVSHILLTSPAYEAKSGRAGQVAAPLIPSSTGLLACHGYRAWYAGTRGYSALVMRESAKRECRGYILRRHLNFAGTALN